jgi:hypothetical protein
METPNRSGAFSPDAAFAGAAERFFDLSKIFGLPGTGAPGQLPDWSSLAGPLAGQFEQWLRMSQSAGPWFGAGAGGAPAAPGAGFAAAAPAWSFGPLPLGPGVAQPNDAQRSFELLGRLAQLQGQLAAHWSEIAGTAAQRFVARLPTVAGHAATPDNALKLYELWVDCAEEAYAAAVRKDEFCRLQSELANTSAALLVEQRRHAETLVRAFGLPTCNEMEALYAQLRELRGELAKATQAPAAPGRAPPARPPGKSKAARAKRPAGARQAGRRGRGARARRPRA